MIFFAFCLSAKIYVNWAGVSTMVSVTSPVKLVKHGRTPVQSARTWALIYPLLKLKKKMCIYSTDTMVIRRGLVWMTLPLKDYSHGWMGVQINSTTGPRNNQTTLEGRTAYTLLVLNMDTRGMTWTVLHVISILVKKVIKLRLLILTWEKCNIVHLRSSLLFQQKCVGSVFVFAFSIIFVCLNVVLLLNKVPQSRIGHISHRLDSMVLLSLDMEEL